MTTINILDWPLVKRGHDAHPVKTLQYILRQREYQIEADGEFGPKTEQAVKDFQSYHDLVIDGQVGKKTWPMVIVSAWYGRQGEVVKGIQEEFQFRNLSGDPSLGLKIDGIFGRHTMAAVIMFQESCRIPSDGLVGPLTWRALVSGMYSF